jgi:hypothetical protein
MVTAPGLLLLLASCVSSEGSAAASAKEASTPAFDDTTGSIQGIVFDEELSPIPNAQVGILSPVLSTTTDAEGRFVLNFVPAGEQRVFANALDFEPQAVRVNVVAGQVSEDVRFALSRLPTLGPYHQTDIFKLVVGGYMVKATPDCMYPVPGQATYKTCVGGSLCNTGPCEVHYGHCKEGGSYSKYGCDLTPEWQTIIGEVMWKPQSGVTGRGWIFEVLAPNVTRADPDGGSVDQSDKHDFFQISSKAPIRTWVDDAALAARGLPATDRCGGKSVDYPHCDWVWRLFPGWCTIGGLTGELAGCSKTGPDFAVDYNGNPVEVYFSYFVREPAPSGWTGLPDG